MDGFVKDEQNVGVWQPSLLPLNLLNVWLVPGQDTYVTHDITGVLRRNQSNPLAQRGRCVDTTEHGRKSRLTLFATVNGLYYVSFYATARV